MNYRYNFNDKKESNKKKIIFSIVFILIVIMISATFFRNSENKVVNAISSVLSYPVIGVKNAFSWVGNGAKNIFTNKDKLLEENKKLEEENNNLKLQALETEKILQENESLKTMLDIKNSYKHFNLKLGNVIYREHDNWTQTFQINIGSNDGVKLNQAVVHKDGLVGYISKVNDTTSTVTTILDPSSAVSVNISTINEPAMLQGLGSMYPSSIPVAKITEVVSKKNDINRYAITEPCVDIKKISEVAVIIN